MPRAEHRGWIEFGSAVLNDIAGFYAAPDEATFKAKTAQLEQKFARLEARVVGRAWFDGENFSLVDAVFGPVFRYFDVFDDVGRFRHSRGQAEARALAHGARGAAIGAIGGRRGLSGAAARFHRAAAIVAVGSAGAGGGR